jgi:hypothetical protein
MRKRRVSNDYMARWFSNEPVGLAGEEKAARA